MTTATHPHEPSPPALSDGSGADCLPLEGGGEEGEEDGSINGATSLVTTAAATWCLHAAAATRDTDTLLAVFRELLATHHTLHEPAPSLSTQLLSRLSPPAKIGRAHAKIQEEQQQHEEGGESSTKREDSETAPAAAVEHSESHTTQQQAAASSKRLDGELTAAAAGVCTPATARSQRGSLKSAAPAAVFEEKNEDVIPAFPVYEAILQSDWKDERTSRVKTRKKKRGSARVTNDTVVTSPGQKSNPVSPGGDLAQSVRFAADLHSHTSGNHVSLSASACKSSSLEFVHKPSVEALAGQQQQQVAVEHNLKFADENVFAARTAATAQWSFTFTCRTCGRTDTVEEKSARCRACLAARNASQTSNEVTKHAVEKFSERETTCVVCGRGREPVQGGSAASAHTNTDCNTINSSSADTQNTNNDDDESYFEDLLLPPAVPVSSALKRISPEAVRLWKRFAQHGKGLTKRNNFILEDSESRSFTTEKRSEGRTYCTHTEDTTSIPVGLPASYATANSGKGPLYTIDNDYTDGKEVFDLLRVVKPRKSSDADDVHVRAQLACLVAGDLKKRHEMTEVNENNDGAAEDPPRSGTAERPEARKLASAVLNALRKLPPHERREDAFLELLLSWYYAGFFTGRLSVCLNGDKIA